MIKTTLVLAGLLTAFTTLGANAAVLTHVPGAKPNIPASTSECGFNAAMQPRLQPAEIAGIARNQEIWLTPICEDTLERNSYGTLFRDGNVETLRNVIARNPALMGELVAHGYDQFDVVAVRFSTDSSVNLFVHQRDMR